MQDKQSKYTAVLTLFWQDLAKDEDDYVFVPSLRRSLRLSATSRCSPLFGSDLVKDDARVGFNGGTRSFLPGVSRHTKNHCDERADSCGWDVPRGV
jgi:hypothetical protein